MTSLVPILTGSVQFFFGLLALLLVGMTIGNFVSLYWLRRDVEAIGQEVCSLGEKINRPGKPAKKRKNRGRKQTARPSKRRKEKRENGVHRPAWLD